MVPSQLNSRLGFMKIQGWHDRNSNFGTQSLLLLRLVSIWVSIFGGCAIDNMIPGISPVIYGHWTGSPGVMVPNMWIFHDFSWSFHRMMWWMDLSKTFLTTSGCGSSVSGELFLSHKFWLWKADPLHVEGSSPENGRDFNILIWGFP